MEVCTAKACHKDLENQRVVIDKDKCIGCKTYIIACLFGMPLFDMMERVPIKCDYYEGDSKCVAFCETRAVGYVDADKVNMNKKRDISLKFYELMRQTVGGR